MPTDDDNTRYELDFQRGQDGWDDELCAIIDALAIDVPMFGTRQARPNAALSFAPDLYIVTDRDPPLIYHNNDGSWERVPTEGPQGPMGERGPTGPQGPPGEDATAADVAGETITPSQVGTDTDPVDSVHTDELSVGTTETPTTGIAGTSGELVARDSVNVLDIQTFTNTTYGFWTVNANTPQIAPTRLALTNVSAYFVSFTASIGRADGDATATTYLRFRDLPSSEVTATGLGTAYTTVSSPLVPVADAGIDMTADAARYPLAEIRTNKGTGRVNNITFQLYGEIA